MSFFDKKQDVIEVKLTQFGKNLLARGAFKPVFYQFFDDDILYNSDAAGFKESQKRSEERIAEAPRLKVQHSLTGIETSFDQNQNEINLDSIRAFMEIARRQDPILTDKILKYPLNYTKANTPKGPSFNVKAHELEISSSSDTVVQKGITYDIPQINFSSSYELFIDRHKEKEIPEHILEYQTYVDLMANKVEFLDDSFVEVRENNITLSLVELETESFIENFDLEIFEVDENGNHIRLTKEQVDEYFNIEADDQIEITPHGELRNDRFYKGDE
tara:strand:+ start:419 stop:1240 length:822 start_codon:yes stop_codon:yes gene_type:complete